MTALLNRGVDVAQRAAVGSRAVLQLIEGRIVRHLGQVNQPLFDRVKAVVEAHELVADVEEQKQRNHAGGRHQGDYLAVGHSFAFSLLNAPKVKEPRYAQGL